MTCAGVPAKPFVLANFEVDGFAIVKGHCPEAELNALLPFFLQDEAGTRTGLTIPEIRAFAETWLAPLAESIVGNPVYPIRGILFDKSPGANWKVPWHQDIAMPVQKRHEVPGFVAWSVKEGLPHVRLPDSVLERVVTLRLHFDDCGAENGPLVVLPGSHRGGTLPESEAGSGEGALALVVQKGDVIVTRPLLLHSSSPATSASHRRVLHVEYSGTLLPEPLLWVKWS